MCDKWRTFRALLSFLTLVDPQALRNVSHAYTLDHQQEEQLFIDLDEVWC